MDEDNQLETWEYQGGTFTNVISWKMIGSKALSDLNIKPIYNIDYEKPLGSGYYTAKSARQAVPNDNRLLNLILIYKTSEVETVKEQFVGNSTSAQDWSNEYNWMQIKNENILNWKSDNATTRGQYHYGNRREGVILTYKRDNKYWITEMFVGKVLNDNNWKDDANWLTITNGMELKASVLGFDADYLVMPVYGQSLSMGNGTVLKTDNESYNNVTADNGISGAPDGYNSIVAIPNNTGNTVAQSVSQYISKLLQESNYKYISIFTTSQGSGGQPIANLAKSQKIIDIVQKTVDYAMQAGKSVNVPTIVWIQGEADQTKSYNYYLEAQVSMIRYLNREIKSLTGQKNDVVFSCYQTGSYEKASNKDVQSEIPKVQFDLDKEYPLFRIMSAIYALPFNDDQLHVNNVGSRIMGATIANGIVDMLFYNKRNIVRISDVSICKNSSGTNWLIRLVLDAPSLPIVIDESPKYYDYGSDVAEDVPHYGFELKIDGHDIITGISLSQGNVINIVVSQDPTGQVLYYAKRGNQGGGYIRDSQGDNYKCLVNGVEYRCDNWLPIQRIKL